MTIISDSVIPPNRGKCHSTGSGNVSQELIFFLFSKLFCFYSFLFFHLFFALMSIPKHHQQILNWCEITRRSFIGPISRHIELTLDAEDSQIRDVGPILTRYLRNLSWCPYHLLDNDKYDFSMSVHVADIPSGDVRPTGPCCLG